MVSVYAVALNPSYSISWSESLVLLSHCMEQGLSYFLGRAAFKRFPSFHVSSALIPESRALRMTRRSEDLTGIT